MKKHDFTKTGAIGKYMARLSVGLYESARLSNRLDEPTERINQMGKFSEPEIDSIKRVQKIPKEIEIFKSHLSSE